MAFKFRRTKKIAPGLRINLTHRGISARVGTKGIGYTVNANGRQHISAGIPGSGIHVSEQVKAPRKGKAKSVMPNEEVSTKTSFGRLLMMGALMVLGGLAAIVTISLLN